MRRLKSRINLFFLLLCLFYNAFSIYKEESIEINRIGIENGKRLMEEIRKAKHNATIYLKPHTCYNIDPTFINKKINIYGRGATIAIKPNKKDKNTCITFYQNAKIKNIVFSGVAVNYVNKGVSSGLVKSCVFINQTYTAISTMGGAKNIRIVNCKFTGRSKGLNRKSTFPCLQITTGSKNILFKNNRCTNVEAGVTADGMDKLLDNIRVINNKFSNLTYYALKTDVGNNFLFVNNEVSNSLYGVFYESLDEDVKYSKRSGNGVNVLNNIFSKVDRCLYIAGKNPFTEVKFNGNRMTNCKYGVNRSCGELLIRNNDFIGGTSLYHYFDALVEGNVYIIGNKIMNTHKDKELKKDWDKEEIQGAIVFSCGRMSNLGCFIIERNTFQNWEGKAIHVARIANSYADIQIINNKFITDNIKSENILTLGAAQFVNVENNRLFGGINEPVRKTNRFHVAYKLNSGKSSRFIESKNSWQKINNVRN